MAELDPKEVLRIHSQYLGVCIGASQEQIDRVHNEKKELHQRTCSVSIVSFFNAHNLPEGRVSSERTCNEYAQILRSYLILKSRIKCNGCNDFMIPLQGIISCSQKCLDLYQTKVSSMQEINNKLQQTNLDPRVENTALVHDFFILFANYHGSSCDCEHVPFTPMCNDFSSIQEAI